MNEPFMRIAEAAEIMGVDRTTILRWIGKGHLRCARTPSGTYRIARSAWEGFLAKCREAKSARRIAIIDDDPVILSVMKEMVEALEMGIEVRTYQNELDALMEIRLFEPDLLIVDYKLEKVDGITVAERIRQNVAFASIPIVLVSGVIDNVDPKEHGFRAFLRKPFRTEEFQKIIKESFVPA